MRPRLPTLVCLLTAAALFPMARPAAAQYRIDTWTTEHGLPQSTIFSILQTRDGFLWVSTFGGLARFDGTTFRVFDTTTNPEMKNSRLAGLREDSDGRLWVITQDRYLMELRNGRFITYGTANGLPAETVGVVEQRGGRLVIETAKGVVIWQDGRFVPHVLPYPQGGGDTQAGSTYGGGRFYRTASGVMRRFVEGEQTRTVTLPVDGGAYEDAAGGLWQRNGDDLVRTRGGASTTYGRAHLRIAINQLTVNEDPDGTLWFLQRDGLIRFRNDQFTTYTTAEGLPHNSIRFLYRDREGTQWAGTEVGLARLTDRPVTSYTVDDGLAANNSYPIIQDRRGDIWIGGWPGLTRFRNGRFERVAPAGLGQANILSLLEDRDGGIWVGAYGGGARRIKDGTLTTVAGQGAPGITYAIHQDRKTSDIWFGTGSGLRRYRDGQFTAFAANEGFHGGQVNIIHEDRHGVMWIGSDAGLTRYDGRVFTDVGERDGFSGRRVRAIHEDRSGAMWIGTYDTGLFRLRDGVFTRYTTHQGLPANGAFRILEDDEARFWISSNAGIYRVAISQLDELAAGLRRTVTAVPYGRNDGMRNQECNGMGQPAGVRARDGRLWFPTQEGVAVIDPATMTRHTTPPPVSIMDLLVGGQSTGARDRIEIRSGGSSIEAHYAALTYVRPELSRFRYRMEGLDPEWVEAGTDRTARYAALPYGTFRFRVIAANRDGVWNEEGASVAIVVVRPFYRTTWFAGLVMTVLALTALAVHRWRIGLLQGQQILREAFSRQLIETQEEERRRVAAGLHDSLSQTLMLMKNWAVMGQRTVAPDHQAHAPLGDISTAASDALDEVREISYNLGPHNLERIGLAATIHDMVNKVASAAGIQFTAHPAQVDGLLSKEQEIAVFRVIQEALNNIIKHSGATEASLVMQAEPHAVRVTILDNGRGFDQASTAGASPDKHGFGLFGMSERLRLVGGRFRIESTRGAGTLVEFELPAAGPAR